MTSRYDTAATTAASNKVYPSSVSSSVQNQSSNQSSASSSFSGITDLEALKALQALISQLGSGGTAQDKAQQANRNAEISLVRDTRGGYSKDAALADAAALMKQNLRQSLEKNMPMITRSVEGAGTSASSMQGLLAQKLATESAQAAGALGAQQAIAYGGINSSLSSVLEALTRADPNNNKNLIDALALLKNSTSVSSSIGTSTGTGTQQSRTGYGTPTQEVKQQPQQETQPIIEDNNTVGWWEYGGGNEWASYGPGGTNTTSNDYPSGYMSVTNTTNNSYTPEYDTQPAYADDYFEYDY